MSEQVYRPERGPRHIFCLILSVPGDCWSAQISAEQWGAVMGDEVATGVHGVFPLPMGMERKDRCE